MFAINIFSLDSCQKLATAFINHTVKEMKHMANLLEMAAEIVAAHASTTPMSKEEP